MWSQNQLYCNIEGARSENPEPDLWPIQQYMDGISETKERDCNCARGRCLDDNGGPPLLVNRGGNPMCANGKSCSGATVDDLPKPYCPLEVQRLRKGTARASWAVSDVLSEGGTAASVKGLGIARYAQYAIEVVERMKQRDWYVQTHFRKLDVIGTRPIRHPNWVVGGKCGAWQAHCSVML
jgi:hypothetical protein